MILIAVFLLVSPGVLSWKLADNGNLDTLSSVMRTLFTLLIDCTLVFLVSYVALNVIYGPMTMSFSSVYESKASASIFSVPFAWKYGVMSNGFGICLGLAKKLGAWVLAKVRKK